jgi:hypothetical protein
MEWAYAKRKKKKVMIELLNVVLDYLFNSQVTLLGSRHVTATRSDHVGFSPPDDDWRKEVAKLGAGRALNVYLVDLREHRKLRTNESTRSLQDGIFSDEPAPMRMDCHYLISAWSTNQIHAEKVAEELAVLYQAAAVLVQNPVIVPRRVFETQVPAVFPTEQLTAEWPATVLPPDGFPKLAEFWGTMGILHPWKPVVYLVVTLPIEFGKQVSGPMVTTRISGYGLVDVPGNADALIQIGGTVWDDKRNPVANAWVSLEWAGGQQTSVVTGADGRFTFPGLEPGVVTLRVRAAGYSEFTRQQMEIPSPDGNYDANLVD